MSEVDEANNANAVVATPVVLVEPPDQTPTINTPLSDSQKYLMRSYQNKLNFLAKQKSEIDVQVARVEGAMQVDMMKIALTNNIDPVKFGFNDNLEIIAAAQQPGQGGLPPRRA
jgi:hypothetical protein